MRFMRIRRASILSVISGGLLYFVAYLMIILDASVFPEPDSPEITIHVSLADRFIVCKRELNLLTKTSSIPGKFASKTRICMYNTLYLPCRQLLLWQICAEVVRISHGL